MKFAGAFLTLFTGLMLSLVAAFISVYGMIQLFAAHAIVVAIMIGSIELGKLVAAGWLKIYWSNPTVAALHKGYLIVAVAVTMFITSLGVFGFLSAGHLEQKAPQAGLEIQMQQLEVKLAQETAENTRLQQRLQQIDQNISVFLQNDQASRGLSASQTLKKERAEIQAKIEANDTEINALNEKLVPLKMQNSNVEAKLGPIKYVAALAGSNDTESAVRIVILILIIAFDPLAVVLLLSAMITLREWDEERRSNRVGTIPSVPEMINAEEPMPDNLAKTAFDDGWVVELDHKAIPAPEPTNEAEAETISDQVPEYSSGPCEDHGEDHGDESNDTMMDRNDFINLLEKNPEILNEIGEIVEEEVEQELTDREKLLDLLEKNPSIINDMAELIASQLVSKDGKSWLK